MQSSTPRSTSANKENTSVVSMSKKKYKSQTPSRQVVKTTRRLSHPAFGTKSGTSSLSSKVSQSASRGHQSSSRAQPSRNLPGDVSVLKELKKQMRYWLPSSLVLRKQKQEWKRWRSPFNPHLLAAVNLMVPEQRRPETEMCQLLLR